MIEGLDALVKLQDLSLFNNHISVIENMDALQNLQILSLGNNLISQLDHVSLKVSTVFFGSFTLLLAIMRSCAYAIKTTAEEFHQDAV